MKENTRIPFLAGRLSEATSTFILESLKREGMGELLPCHGDILHVLTEQETATVMELARLTHRSKSTVSALVTKLVDMGYVARERSAEDSRVINLRLTEKGRAFIPVSERISSELDALVTCPTPDVCPFPPRRSAPRENPQRLFLRQVRLRPSGHFRRAFRPDLNHSPALIFAKIDGRPPRFDPLRAQRRKPLQNSV